MRGAQAASGAAAGDAGRGRGEGSARGDAPRCRECRFCAVSLRGYGCAEWGFRTLDGMLPARHIARLTGHDCPLFRRKPSPPAQRPAFFPEEKHAVDVVV